LWMKRRKGPSKRKLEEGVASSEVRKSSDRLLSVFAAANQFCTSTGREGELVPTVLK